MGENIKTAIIRTNFIRHENGADYQSVDFFYDQDSDPDFIAYRALLYLHMSFRSSGEKNAAVYTTLRYMLNIAGARGKNVSNLKKSKTFQLLKKCITWFVEHEYIHPLDEDLENLPVDNLFKIDLIEENFFIAVNGTKDGKPNYDEPFIVVSFEEYEKLTTLNSRASLNIAHLFLYIKSRMLFSTKKHPDMPRCKLISQSAVAQYIHCTQPQASEFIKILVNEQLLARKKSINPKNSKQTAYIYTDDIANCDEELQKGVDYYYGKIANGEYIIG